MQMSGRRDGDRIDAEIEQIGNIAHGLAAEGTGDEFSLLAIGIGNADEFGARQAGKDTRVVAAHHADADHANADRTSRLRIYRLRHVLTKPPDRNPRP